ncbi:L-threonylcarbamoyladenylate synthase [Candidatus Poribacteria bacterium]
MKAVVLKIDPVNPDPSKLQEAADLLKAGKLVAFPTDTVYGVGADAFNEEAVERIFAAKKRDANKPLQVLIAQKSDLQAIAEDQSEILERLASEFWPGPLTLVMSAKADFPQRVRCGGKTIGVRMPANPVALRLIEAFGTPIAATSANISSSPDPVSAGEVMKYLGDKVDLILDGGPTSGGIPSTVLDISVHPPVVLRQGKLSSDVLKRVIDLAE